MRKPQCGFRVKFYLGNYPQDEDLLTMSEIVLIRVFLVKTIKKNIVYPLNSTKFSFFDICTFFLIQKML